MGEQTIRTAGKEDHIRLSMDYRGAQTCFIKAEVVDKDGNLCPWAEDDITFHVDGGTILGADNGSQFSMERFQPSQAGAVQFHRKAFFGKAVLVVRPDGRQPFTVTAVSPMLKKEISQF